MYLQCPPPKQWSEPEPGEGGVFVGDGGSSPEDGDDQDLKLADHRTIGNGSAVSISPLPPPSPPKVACNDEESSLGHVPRQAATLGPTMHGTLWSSLTSNGLSLISGPSASGSACGGREPHEFF